MDNIIGVNSVINVDSSILYILSRILELKQESRIMPRNQNKWFRFLSIIRDQYCLFLYHSDSQNLIYIEWDHKYCVNDRDRINQSIDRMIIRFVGFILIFIFDSDYISLYVSYHYCIIIVLELFESFITVIERLISAC